MINSSIVCKVYLRYISNEITREEAINQLIVLVLENKVFFGIQCLTKEKTQDFLYYFIQKTDNILERYNPEKALFSTYFQMKIRFAFESWKKNNANMSIKNDIPCNTSFYEEYEKDFHYLYTPESAIDSMIFEEEPIYYPDNKKNKTKPSELELLIIALKSSYYISNDYLEKIMKNVAIDKNLLLSYISELNESLINKICLKNKISFLINKDFVKMQILKSKMKIYKGHKEKQELWKKRFLIVKKKRAKRIERLKSIKLVPSDTEISKLLNISTGKIRYIIRKNYKIYNIQQSENKIS